MMLQRHLANADASLSGGDSNVDQTLEHVSEAFDDFRARYHDGAESSASSTTASEAQRAALLTLAAAIAEMD